MDAPLQDPPAAPSRPPGPPPAPHSPRADPGRRPSRRPSPHPASTAPGCSLTPPREAAPPPRRDWSALADLAAHWLRRLPVVGCSPPPCPSIPMKPRGPRTLLPPPNAWQGCARVGRGPGPTIPRPPALPGDPRAADHPQGALPFPGTHALQAEPRGTAPSPWGTGPVSGRGPGSAEGHLPSDPPSLGRSEMSDFTYFLAF